MEVREWEERKKSRRKETNWCIESIINMVLGSLGLVVGKSLSTLSYLLGEY